MKICLVAEGSYPFVTGGVSSWIQTLINSIPEHQFVIYAIGAQTKMQGKFKYSLPNNVLEVREVFLDTYMNEETSWGKRHGLTQAERKIIAALISGINLDWEQYFSLLMGRKLPSVSEFLTSKDYLDIVREICEEFYPQIPFTEVFWTIRSMILPLFMIIRNGMPEADLYHSVSTGYGGVLGCFGKFIYNKPFLLTEHGIYSREREQEIIKADWIKGYLKDIWINYFLNLCKCSYGFADQVIALFQQNKQIQTELGCQKEIIRVIPNGVRVEEFEDIPRKDPDDPFINIGAVIRVVPIKDVKTMLQSFAIVKHEIPIARFYIFGPTDEDPEYFAECKQLVEVMGLKDLFFMGNVNVKEYIAKMDVLVLTSISEGQPLAVLEGMACCVPFVTTDVGSCRELLYGNDDRLGQAGLVVPVMQYEQVAQAIITICRNEKIRMEMGRNGQNRVSQYYTTRNFIDEYRNLYREFGG